MSQKLTSYIIELNMKYLKIILAIIFLGILFSVSNGHTSTPLSQPNKETVEARITFLNVGQGDSVLIESQGKIMLIDAGPDNSASQKLGLILPPKIKDIDLVLLTHAHDDHFSGFKKIFEKFSVKNIIQGQAAEESPSHKDFLKSEKNEQLEDNAKIISIATSTSLKIGTCEADIFSPLPEAKNENDRSLVTKLNCNGHSFLLAGDLGPAGQSALLENGTDIKSEVYKASHHGADTNNIESFINQISPQTIVIQVGKNSYGHPGKKFLNYAANQDLTILRTDKLGSISFIISDKDMKISNFR